MKKHKSSLIMGLLILFLANSCKKEVKLSGSVFGTSYAVNYYGKQNYKTEFDSLFDAVNSSMSTYIPNSIISKINRNESVTIDKHFKTVFEASTKVFNATNGAFDPTIGAVVNAWDFGPEGTIEDLDSVKIKSLMKSVGLNKVSVSSNKITKQQDTKIDFNAIAKGYGVDVVAEFLESQNIDNYIVEIGGEIRAKGINVIKEKPWKVGIETPRFDGMQSLMKVISIKDCAMATSGTYRKFKIDENGNRYAHIIDTRTGFPSKTNLLSISVIAKNCMIADAYATAFKAMGIEKVKDFLKYHDELRVFLIFENENSELETLSFNGFPDS